VGGIIIRNVPWAWVFWINIPVGLAAATGFTVFLHENVKHERRSIDVAGALSFAIAVTSLLIALTEIGTSGHSLLAAGAVFCVSTMAFVVQERRVANPMVSFALWSHRPIAATNAVAVLSGMALIGLTTFLPIYVQIVLHRSPVIAGLALTTMLVGWPAGATVAARLFHRFALHQLLLTGALLLPVGATLFVLLGPQSSPLVAALGSLIMGFGMGLLSVSSLVLIQEIVDRSQRGSATASNLFSRNLGSTLGATALGAVLNHGLTRSVGVTSLTSDRLRQLLETSPGTTPGDAAIRMALQHSLNLTFWAVLAVSLTTVLAALLVPAVAIPHPNEAPVKIAAPEAM
jgi:Na+/melibiose symporter-like transporter